MVAVPPPVGGDVLHGQWAGPAVLHCPVFTTRLCELHVGRRHTGELARDLERGSLPALSHRPAIGGASKILRQLRAPLEPLACRAALRGDPAEPSVAAADT